VVPAYVSTLSAAGAATQGHSVPRATPSFPVPSTRGRKGKKRKRRPKRPRKSPLTSLPPEILFEVFSYLERPDAQSLAATSSHLFNIFLGGYSRTLTLGGATTDRILQRLMDAPALAARVHILQLRVHVCDHRHPLPVPHFPNLKEIAVRITDDYLDWTVYTCFKYTPQRIRDEVKVIHFYQTGLCRFLRGQRPRSVKIYTDGNVNADVVYRQAADIFGESLMSGVRKVSVGPLGAKEIMKAGWFS
jgi:hypothetical protein